VTGDSREVLTRPAPPPDRTLRYGPDPEQVVDVRGTAGPVLIFIHGGFWRAEYDRGHTGPLAADLAARGWRVATIEYRRTGQPGGGWPGTCEDVVAAVEAVRREYPATEGVGAPVIAGHSAGGHLALWYSSHFADRIRAVVALAPVADLALAHRLRLDDGAVDEFLGGGPEQQPQRYASADPTRLTPPTVPVTVLHGDRDQQVPMSISCSYVASVRAVGGSVDLVELPDTEHFDLIDPLSSAWPVVLDQFNGLVVVARRD